MKRLLPIVLIITACVAFNSSCKKNTDVQPDPQDQDTIPPPDTIVNNDTIFLAANKYVVYIDSANNIKRLYQYNFADSLIQYTIYSTVNDSTKAISIFNGDNVLTKELIYVLDTNNRAKYYKEYVNGVFNDITEFTYNTDGRLIKLIDGGATFNIQWSNSNIILCGSNYHYDSTRVAKVELFSPPLIGNDNNLTGVNSVNYINTSYVASMISGQGMQFQYSNVFVADSSDYITTLFKQVSLPDEQVKGAFNYYTYIVE